jgi:hypothetical protein
MRRHIPGDEQAADQGARRAGPVRRQVKVAIVARRSLFEALIELPETLLSLLSGLRILVTTMANR